MQRLSEIGYFRLGAKRRVHRTFPDGNYQEWSLRRMPLRLMLAANLRRYLPGYDGETGYEVSVKPESTVRDLCRKLAIPEKEVKLIMIEGIAASLDSVLTGNERVALFPPIGGG
jgi:sulfur carrier protein ThiS